MYIKGFGVLTWSDPSLALWVKYSSFNHIEYAVLKKMGVFYSTYDYVFRERAVQLLIINREPLLDIRMKPCANMPVDHHFGMCIIT